MNGNLTANPTQVGRDLRNLRLLSLCFLCLFRRLVVACGYSLVFVWMIRTSTLFRSDKEVITNLYSLVRYIRSEILSILNILGLPIM